MNLTRDWLIANGIAPATIDAALNRAAQPAKLPHAFRGAVKGVMNYTEQRFANLIDDRRWIEPVFRWDFEGETLILAPDMAYTPDFRIVTEAAVVADTGSIVFVDVKGKHTWEDSIIKGKAAAVLFPRHRFFLAQLKSGEWRVRQFGTKLRRTWSIPA